MKKERTIRREVKENTKIISELKEGETVMKSLRRRGKFNHERTEGRRTTRKKN